MNTTNDSEDIKKLLAQRYCALTGKPLGVAGKLRKARVRCLPYRIADHTLAGQ